MAAKTKILLVDDHPFVREWLTILVRQEPDLEACGSAGTAPEALALVGNLQPHVVVVDINLVGTSGLELIKDIKTMHPQVATIVLSMHEESLYAERAMRAGAAGYIMKREATSKVLEGIRTVAGGGLFYSHAVNTHITQKIIHGTTATPTLIESLSDRELEVFQWLGRGFSTRQISEQMNVSFKTVHAYCARIKDKLNFGSINELVFHAIRWHESQNQQ